MKIADISEFYSAHGGGVRTYVRQKLAASARLGLETIIIAPGPEDREELASGGKIVWVKAPVLPLDPRYHIFTSGAGVRAVLDRERPDVVEGSSPWRGGWIAATWTGDAVKALFMHADPVAVYPQTLLGGTLGRARVDRMFGWFWAYLRRLNGQFDATIVAGDWLAQRFRNFGMTDLHAVPMGVDRDVFFPARRANGARTEMLHACGLPEDAQILISVGRHHPEKRLDTVMDAVAIANATTPVGLFLVGDGITRRAVERKAARSPHIHVAGQIHDRARLATLMASADALIHGSASETYGIAVAEALCCGTPIIVPDAGGAADFADDACGESYAAGDAQAGAAAILRLLARNNAGLRQAAEIKAATKIGPADAHFDHLFAFYEKLVREKSSAGGAPVAPKGHSNSLRQRPAA